MRATLLPLATTEFWARRSTAVLLVILLAAGSCSALLAFSKPLWSDEIVTVLLCRLPSASAVWEALENTADDNPPLFYYAARLTYHFIPDDHLGYRLPSILGLLGTVLCIFAILSRRVDRLSALVGAVFVLCTPAALYGYEARPYALMLSCISGAILAWQHIDDSRRLYSVALAITLATAVSLHYYAILVWPAFVLAEAAVWIFHRRFRVGAWAALSLGGLPIIAFANNILRVSHYYGPNFWEHPRIGQIFTAPNWLFNLGGLWGWVLTVGVTVTFLRWSLKGSTLGSSGQRKVNDSPFSVEEGVLTIVLLWLPLIAVAAAKVGPGALTFRYMQPTVLGGALAVGYLTSKVPGTARMLLLAMMLMNYGLSSLRDLTKVLDGSVLNGSLLKARASMADKFEAIRAQDQDRGHPIVISSGIHYLPMAYYTPSDRSQELYTLTDPDAAVMFAKSDSVDLNLLVLQRYFPLRVQDYRDFASRNPDFLLVSDGDMFDWWPARLAHDGHTLKLLSETGNTRIYKVSLKPDRRREVGSWQPGKERIPTPETGSDP